MWNLFDADNNLFFNLEFPVACDVRRRTGVMMRFHVWRRQRRRQRTASGHYTGGKASPSPRYTASASEDCPSHVAINPMNDHIEWILSEGQRTYRGTRATRRGWVEPIEGTDRGPTTVDRRPSLACRALPLVARCRHYCYMPAPTSINVCRCGNDPPQRPLPVPTGWMLNDISMCPLAILRQRSARTSRNRECFLQTIVGHVPRLPWWICLHGIF